MTEISVCFCSRGRPASLARALASLLDTADDPAEIKITVAIDQDDEAMAQALRNFGTDPATTVLGRPEVYFWVAPERYGYTGLHHYLNALAKMAKGRWVMWFNDDMAMKTQGWDTVVRAAPQGVLWPAANHVAHANIAPIWPRAWSDATGYVTPTMHMDTWLQYVAEHLGCHHKIPVEIEHDRFDVTGNPAHDDPTYREGRALLGPEGMHSDFGPAMARLGEYIETVRGLL